MSNTYVPNYEMNLMKLNVLALQTEGDCLIALEELRRSTF